MSLVIRQLSTIEFSINAPSLVDVYIRAMGYDSRFRNSHTQSWRQSILKDGFSAVCAAFGDEIVGIAFGFNGSADQWWQRQLHQGLRTAGALNEKNISLLNDYFEVAEVHVLPAYQGCSIGRKMMYQLLKEVSKNNAILSTPEVEGENNPAFHLYRSLGFNDLLRHFYFQGDSREFAVLTAALPLNAPAQRNQPPA